MNLFRIIARSEVDKVKDLISKHHIFNWADLDPTTPSSPTTFVHVVVNKLDYWDVYKKVKGDDILKYEIEDDYGFETIDHTPNYDRYIKETQHKPQALVYFNDGSEESFTEDELHELYMFSYNHAPWIINLNESFGMDIWKEYEKSSKLEFHIFEIPSQAAIDLKR